ncbi:MAG: radical SAM protein [Clostridiales bacterium]|nr:radical SAM protein [Clostridiales bacterium]
MEATEWEYKPNTIQIETVQGCNRRCKFCGTMGIEKRLYFADIKTILHTANLIKEAKLNCRILLAGHGEPTLHPKIVEVVKAIRGILPNNMIHMFTNGTVIEKHPEMIAELFSAGLNDLVFDEYKDSRVGNFVRGNPMCNTFEIVEQGSGVPLFAPKDINIKRICITPPIDRDGNTAGRYKNRQRTTMRR